MKNSIVLSCVLIAALLCLAPDVQAGEIDAITVVDRVIDGDTFDTTSEGRVRLADIDTPELGEPGYNAAKALLIGLIDDQTVHLDIDDVYGTDPYDRLVCVVYVRHNSTHYMNVNQALLIEGVVVVQNYDNEFGPYSWTLYTHEAAIPEYPAFTVLPLFMIVGWLVVLLWRKDRSLLGPMSQGILLVEYQVD